MHVHQICTDFLTSGVPGNSSECCTFLWLTCTQRRLLNVHKGDHTAARAACGSPANRVLPAATGRAGREGRDGLFCAAHSDTTHLKLTLTLCWDDQKGIGQLCFIFVFTSLEPTDSGSNGIQLWDKLLKLLFSKRTNLHQLKFFFSQVTCLSVLPVRAGQGLLLVL